MELYIYIEHALIEFRFVSTLVVWTILISCSLVWQHLVDLKVEDRVKSCFCVNLLMLTFVNFV